MNDLREQVLKRLRLTRRNETICLMEWEVRVLIEWIEELNGRNNHEQTDDHRKSDE